MANAPTAAFAIAIIIHFIAGDATHTTNSINATNNKISYAARS
jgi:hypothetical protein